MALIDDTRADWGAAKPTGTIYTVTWGVKTEVLWHYVDGNPQGMAGKPHTDCLRKVKAFQTFHMGPSRGWSDIGYNALICQHGRVIEGRGIRTVGAQCPNHNRQGIGVQFMVGGSESPTPAAYTRAVQLLADLTTSAAHTFKVMGHSDGTATKCPGSIIYGWLNAGMPVKTNPAPAPAPTPVPTQEEDDMFTDADRALLERVALSEKAGAPGLPYLSAQVKNSAQGASDRAVALTVEVAALKETVGVLANSQGLDPNLIAKLIADKIGAIKVDVVVTNPEETP